MIITVLMSLIPKIVSIKSVVKLSLVVNRMSSPQVTGNFRPKEFKDFFRNPLNKVRLQSYLKTYFSFQCRTLNKRFIYHEQNICDDISSSSLHESVENLQCSHLEADIAILVVYSKIREDNQTTPVSEDSDVVVLCAYASTITNGQLTLKRKRSIIDCKQLCSKEMANIVAPLQSCH